MEQILQIPGAKTFSGFAGPIIINHILQSNSKN